MPDPDSSIKDKAGEFYTRGPRAWRLGFRVMRAHNFRNLKKNAWLLQAIVDRLKKDESEMPAPEQPFPTLPDEVTNDHIRQP